MKGNNSIPIPGELGSVAINKRTAAAEGIFDYKKEKTQEDVNQEFTDDIDDIKDTVDNKMIDSDYQKAQLQIIGSKVDANEAEIQRVNNRFNLVNNRITELDNTVEANKTLADQTTESLHILGNEVISDKDTIQDSIAENTQAIENLGVQHQEDTLSLQEQITALDAKIDSKVIEAGSVVFDLEPTEGNTDHVMSSDAIFNALKDTITSESSDQLVPYLGFDSRTDTLHITPQVLTSDQKRQVLENIGLDLNDNYRVITDVDMEIGYFNPSSLSVGDKCKLVKIPSVENYRCCKLLVGKGSVLKIAAACFITTGNLYIIVNKTTNRIVQIAEVGINTINNPIILNQFDDECYVYITAVVGTEHNYTIRVELDSIPRFVSDRGILLDYAIVQTKIPNLITGENAGFGLQAGTVIWYGKSIVLDSDLFISKPVEGVSIVMYDNNTKSLHTLSPMRTMVLNDYDIPIALVKWNDRVLGGNFISYYKDGELVEFKIGDKFFDTIEQIKKDISKAARDVYIDYKHSPNNPVGGGHEYGPSTYRDAIFIILPQNAATINISGVDLVENSGGNSQNSFCFFYNSVGPITSSTYIGGNRDYIVPSGAKMAVIGAVRSQNPNYDNLSVSFTYVDDSVDTKLASRGLFLVRDHLVNISSGGVYSFISNTNFDCIMVQYQSNAISFKVNGLRPTLVAYCNSIDTPTTKYIPDWDPEEHPGENNGNILGYNRLSDTGESQALKGTKMMALDIDKRPTIVVDGEVVPNPKYSFGDSGVDYSGVYIEFTYPSESHGDYEIRRNELVSYNIKTNPVFRQYVVNNKYYDNIWIEVPDSSCTMLVIEGLNVTTCHYFKAWGVPELDNYILTNKTFTIPEGTKMISVTVKHQDNTPKTEEFPDGNPEGEVDYSDFKYSFTKGDVSSSIPIKKLLQVTVNSSTNSAIVRARYNLNKDVVIQIGQYSDLTESLVIKDVYLGDVNADLNTILVPANSIYNKSDGYGGCADQVCAIFRKGMYAMFAQHGYAVLRIHKVAHGIVAGSEGSIYVDNNGNHFTLAHIQGVDDIIFIPVLHTEVDPPYAEWGWMGDKPNPTTLTYVSGVSVVTELTDFTCHRYDLKVQVSTNRKFIVDGVEVISGTYDCDTFVVSETLVGYDVFNTVWYPQLELGDEIIKLHTSFIFNGPSVTMNRLIEFLKPWVMTHNYGWMPQMPREFPNTYCYNIIPKTKQYSTPFRTNTLPRNNGGINRDVLVLRNGTDLIDINKLPERIVTWLYKTGELEDGENRYIIGAAGCDNLIRGDSRNSIRLTEILEGKVALTYNGSSTPNKFYHKLKDVEGTYGSSPNNSYIEHSGFLTWFDPSLNHEGCKVYWYRDRVNKYVVYVDVYKADTVTELPAYFDINLPDMLEGYEVDTVIESLKCSLVTRVISNGSLKVHHTMSGTSDSGYIVFSLK